ncbi:hypothetical protein BG000_008955 [Podila horticola]|nr:hypothetical protein BG000_008955 [Podila horticola]
MSFLAYRRRILILLVPVVNFIFLALFIISPSSLPRLPKHLSRARSAPPSHREHESTEHIRLGGEATRQEHQQQGDDPTNPSNSTTGENGFNFWLEQRRLVQGVHLKPLPDHLITTYKPEYLYASRSQFTSSTDNTEFRKEPLDPTEKYLTFLPHSGFHNQRSELENALVLARLLNRTLIIPKVYLGPPMPWLTFNLLHSRLLYQTKTGLEHCRALIDDQFEDTEEDPHTTTPGVPVVKLEEIPLVQPMEMPQPDVQSMVDNPVVANSPVYAPEKGFTPVVDGESRQNQQQQQQQAAEKETMKILDGQTIEQKELFDKERAWRDIPMDPAPVVTEQIVLNDPNADSDEGEEADLSSEDDFQGDSEDEEDDEKLEPSWIEEDEDDPDTSITTGDDALGAVDLEGADSDEETQPDVEDWESVEDNEEEEGRDLARVGIIDDEPWEDDGDDNEYDIPVRRGSFVLPLQHHHHPGRRNRGRYLAQNKMELEGASLPLYMPIDSSMPNQNPRMWKRSLRKRSNEEAPAQADPTLEKRQQHPFQHERQYQPSEPPQPTVKKPNLRHPKLLPSECLQYESWSMTDWDFFFDLDPLRRYVRIATRESVAMTYLESEFGIQLPKEEKSTLTFDTKSSDGGSDGDSEDGADQEINDNDIAENESDIAEEDDSEKEPPPLLRTAGDVLFFDDSSLYDYMFSENPDSLESAKIRPKYRQEFTIQWLNDRPEKLIHLGSIFGTGRVSIDSLQSKAWLIMILDHLILSTEILQTISQRIAEKISGSNQISSVGQSATQTSHAGLVDVMDAGFVGIHIRMSDGHFSLSACNTIENIRQELMWQMGMSSDQDQSQGGVYDSMHDMENHFHQQQEESNNKNPPESDELKPSSAKTGRLSIEQCRSRALNHREQLFQPSSSSSPRRRSNGRYTPIYLATDAHRPRANPIFDKLFETFDCIFTLDDFAEDIEPLQQFRNPEDGVLMAEFLIPMVDAMVVAKSAAFFGTPASTFSNYIQRQLRPAYTGLYD